MKILFLTQYFPPEVGAPQNRLYELAVRLQKQGAEIEVLTAMPNYPQMEVHAEYVGKDYVKEEMGGMTVHRSSIYVSKERSISKRLKNYFSFVRSSYKVGKKLGPFDIVFCESPPLFLGYTAMKLARRYKAKLVFNVSDLWPESAEKLGIVNNKVMLKMAYRLEAKCYRLSTLVTGQTQGIVKSVSTRFQDKDTYWLPNGVDLSYYDPSLYDGSKFRSEHGLEDKFILLYAGIIGHAQGLEIILEAAEKLKDQDKLRFVLLGAGPEKEKLLQIQTERGLNNVLFLDPVSKQDMPSIVSASDASIVPLRKLDLFKGAIPSKIFENLAMKKPVLLGVDGEARDLFVEQGKCALYFEPENADALTAEINKLTQDKTLYNELAENGRRYVNDYFNRDKIAESFWQKLKEIV